MVLTSCSSQFVREVGQVPSLLATQARVVEPALRVLIARVERRPVRQILTLARGSSDHAAA